MVWLWATRVSDPVRVPERADSPPDRANRPRDTGPGNANVTKVRHRVEKVRLIVAEGPACRQFLASREQVEAPRGLSTRCLGPFYLLLRESFYLA